MPWTEGWRFLRLVSVPTLSKCCMLTRIAPVCRRLPQSVRGQEANGSHLQRSHRTGSGVSAPGSAGRRPAQACPPLTLRLLCSALTELRALRSGRVFIAQRLVTPHSVLGCMRPMSAACSGATKPAAADCRLALPGGGQRIPMFMLVPRTIVPGFMQVTLGSL